MMSISFSFFSTFFSFSTADETRKETGQALIFKTHLLKKTSSWFTTQTFLTEVAWRAQRMSHKTNMLWRFGSSHNLFFQIALRAQRMANKNYLPCCDCCPWSGAKLLCEMLLSGAALLPLDSIVTLHSSSAHSMTENRNFLVTGITSNALSISWRSAFASVSSRSLRKGNKHSSDWTRNLERLQKKKSNFSGCKENWFSSFPSGGGLSQWPYNVCQVKTTKMLLANLVAWVIDKIH